MRNKFVFTDPELSMNEEDLRTISVSVTKDGVKSWKLHFHPFWEVMYYIKGIGVLKTAGRDIPFSPGTIICVPPGFVHGSSSEAEFKNISISTGLYHDPSAKPVICTDNADRDGYQLASLIYKLYYGGKGKNKTALLHLILAFYAFIKTECDSPVMKKDFIDDALNKIIENFTLSDFSLCDLVSQSGYSDDYFRECFKQRIGMTPGKYLNQLRLEHAESLLRTGGRSIAEIAYASGFKDPFYFSRIYKKRTGVSPFQKQKEIFGKDFRSK